MSKEFTTDFTNAPKDEEFTAMVPTGDVEAPFEFSTAWWDEETGRWAGHWQGIPGMEHVQPAAWAAIPDPSDEVVEVFEKIAADAQPVALAN